MRIMPFAFGGRFMIKFSCKCGNIFNLTDDLAGGLIQCTRCGLLNDVPNLADLPFITEDGTIELEEVQPITDGLELADLQEAFSPHTVDANGYEKDLRNDPETYQTIGVNADDNPPRVAPKYDPVTGELIRPLQLKDEVPQPALPIHAEFAGIVDPLATAPMPVIPVAPAGPVKSLRYATGETQRRLSPLTLLVELLMPANVVVLFMVFLFYLFTGFIGTFLAVGSVFFQVSLQVLNLPLWLLLAHYGCVIEDTGPDNHDELPRPLRHFSISEDIWNPLFNVAIAGVLCYFPVMLAARPHVNLGEQRVPIMLCLELLGSFFFPAVVLTTVTGVSLANLRPDRVLSVIRIAGSDYILSVGIFLLAIAPSTFYLVSPRILLANPDSILLARMREPYIMLPLLAITVYFSHYFCWHLGLIYRAHHDQFPWVLQRHIPTQRRNFDVLQQTHSPRESLRRRGNRT